MDKVLVVKAIEPNYNTVSGGPPVMMVGGGGRRRSGDRAVGRTKRERLGSALGGTVGVLGALAGQHRSLGSLAQAMIGGGAQGRALGGAFGRSGLAGVTRRRQARADIDEGTRQRYADLGARGELDRFQFNRPIHQLSSRGNLDRMESQIGVIDAEKARQAQQAREEQARAKAQAAAEGSETGAQNRRDAQSFRDLRDAYQGRFNREAENSLVQVLGQDNPTMRTNVVPEEDVSIVSEEPVDHSGEVQPLNAAGLPVPPQLMLPPPTQPTSHGAPAENEKDNRLSNEFETNTTTSALNRNKVAVTNGNDGNEDEEEGRVDSAELGRIQAGLPRQQPGMRSPGQPVKVQQRSLRDFDEEFEQGGN